MRKMYIVKGEIRGNEFLCEACLEDDDIILEKTADVTCDCCGYSDLPH
jgi:hypothetical protein